MTVDEASDLIRNSLILALLIASPMMIIGLVVGLAVSIFQALTQIQEQTLTFIPKISAMVIAAAILMPWIGTRLLDYATAMFSSGQLP